MPKATTQPTILVNEVHVHDDAHRPISDAQAWAFLGLARRCSRTKRGNRIAVSDGDLILEATATGLWDGVSGGSTLSRSSDTINSVDRRYRPPVGRDSGPIVSESARLADSVQGLWMLMAAVAIPRDSVNCPFHQLLHNRPNPFAFLPAALQANAPVLHKRSVSCEAGS